MIATTFTPPVTADRRVAGLVLWANDDADDDFILLKTDFSNTKMLGVDIGAGNCAVSPSGTKVA